VYVIIALRLVMFAVMPESHGARRSAGQDALATARPDILDRNGGILTARNCLSSTHQSDAQV
jgi:cell division protein FtsI (penicillin-binding protein 3)